MKKIIIVILLLALGAAGIAVQHYATDGRKTNATQQAAPGKKILFYRHPMNPSITSDRPAKDEMGMDYTPVYADGQEQGAPDGAVTISPAVVNNMGVRIAAVERSPLPRRIETVGYVGYDEERAHHVHVRTEGWVERLYVKFAGARVRAGDPLFDLYAPKLVNAQQEYLQALSTGNKFLATASRERLRALGVSAAQIDALEKSRRVEQLVKVYARQDGVVRDLNIREGMFIEPPTEAISLADISAVWVLADVFEGQVGWVAPGQVAEVRPAYQPGKAWKGRVDYIYPGLDPVTRTLKVRLRFDNPGEILKPNMYGAVTIFADMRQGVVHIPREALIRDGREERVILALGDGKFAPRAVRAGAESGERVEILQGLEEGEQVVSSGQFLIDSESNLKAGFTRMTPVASEPMQEIKKAAQGEGVVNTVDDKKINISHGPIEALNWPPMTMDFQLTDPALAQGVKVGDNVQFEFHEGEGGRYVVTKINPKAAP
ncbi:MAG: efflux RND transporter periplasmic adaptor subunit [Pseudomonadota bacterium]